jgi:hypothetical protein
VQQWNGTQECKNYSLHIVSLTTPLSDIRFSNQLTWVTNFPTSASAKNYLAAHILSNEYYVHTALYTNYGKN